MLVKGLKLLICFCMALILAPFNIYADSFTIDNIVGVNTVLSEANQVGTVTYGGTTYNTYLCNYDMEIVLDKSYLGYIQLTIEYEYNTRNSSGVVTNTTNQTRRVYVNGSSVHINLNIFSSYSNAPLTLGYNNPKVTTVTANNTNVTPLTDLSSIQEIIDILNDIYSLEGDIEGISTNQLLELQNIVANTSLANEYLETISKFRQWNIPVESLQAVKYCLDRYEYVPYNNVNYIESYPVFDIAANKDIARFFYNKNYSYILVFGTDYNFSYNSTGINDMFTCTQEILSYQITELYPMNSGFKIVKVILKFANNGNITINLNHASKYIPIYSSLDLYKNFSTDFALRYGFSNSLLDNIKLIANGTNASNSVAQSSDSANSQLQQDSSTLFQQEDSFKTDMQSAMQNVPQFNVNTFGTKFMTSANWVRTQYERMTNNTPFQHLITFSLLVGLSMILIGKVRK